MVPYLLPFIYLFSFFLLSFVLYFGGEILLAHKSRIRRGKKERLGKRTNCICVAYILPNDLHLVEKKNKA